MSRTRDAELRGEDATVSTLTDDLIVCTRNRPDELAVCLQSVLTQTRLPTCTTIVDSSDDDASKRIVDELLPQWPDGHRLVHVGSAPGLVYQRIVGLEATREPIVHYIDDDTVLEPGYFAGILSVFSADEDAAIGGVGGFVTNQPEHRYRRIDEWLGLDSRREGVVLTSGRNIRIYTDLPHDTYVDWLPGCAMSYRRGVLALAPPDANVALTAEDVELSYRVRQHAALVITPRARMEHRTSPRNRASVESSCTSELVERWRRVHAGTGILRERAFWISAFGQLGWYSVKATVTLSRDRLGIARATWRGIREIRAIQRAL
jgi:GT2 family glycosyltransferase